MNENSRASEFRAAWKLCNPHAHVVNLLDGPRGQKKPYDGYVVEDGQMIGIEFKRYTGQSINPKEMRDNQIAGLLEVQDQGFAGLVIAFIDHKLWTNKFIFVCPIKKFIKIFGGTEIGGGVYEWKGSVKITTLQESHPELFVERLKTHVCERRVWKHKKMWDFKRIVQEVCWL